MRILDAMKWRVAIGVLIVSAVALAGRQGRARPLPIRFAVDWAWVSLSWRQGRAAPWFAGGDLNRPWPHS